MPEAGRLLHHQEMKLWPLLLFLILISCGEGIGRNDTSRPDESTIPQAEEVREFSTRLSNTLQISGTRCEGAEEVPCEWDQWLVSVNSGTPFAAELVRFDRVTTANAVYYAITPVSVISPETKSVIDKYLVRFHATDGSASVVAK